MNVKFSKKPLGLIASMFFAFLFAFGSNAVYAKGYEVAYLSASSANTWLGASVKTMEAVASANDINITEFDGQFDPAKQNAQLQDIIASGKYQGIIVCAAYGVGMIPDLEEAIAAGIEIVVLNQIVGPDLTTSDPQVDGIAASVLASPYRSGTRHGELTVRACEGDDNCEVVFIYGIKGIPLDDAIRQGFDDVISQHPSIKVVAEGEGKYLGPEGGITATQDILSMNKSFDVMVGADQSIQGAAIVLADEGMTGQIKLIGLGGSAPAIDGIKAVSYTHLRAHETPEHRGLRRVRG